MWDIPTSIALIRNYTRNRSIQMKRIINKNIDKVSVIEIYCLIWNTIYLCNAFRIFITFSFTVNSIVATVLKLQRKKLESFLNNLILVDTMFDETLEEALASNKNGSNFNVNVNQILPNVLSETEGISNLQTGEDTEQPGNPTAFSLQNISHLKGKSPEESNKTCRSTQSPSYSLKDLEKWMTEAVEDPPKEYWLPSTSTRLCFVVGIIMASSFMVSAAPGTPWTKAIYLAVSIPNTIFFIFSSPNSIF